MYCSKCKALIKDKAKFCPLCGRPLSAEAGEVLHDYRNGITNEIIEKQNTSTKMKPGTAAMVSYLFLPGIIISYVKGDRTNDFLRFHLNQAIVIEAIFLIFCFLTSYSGVVGNLFFIILLAGRAYGIYDAYRGETKGIPYISRIKFLKDNKTGSM